MKKVTRRSILELLQGILARQGKPTVINEDATLREIGFRSLDFSELALRVESESGRTLEFDGAELRGIETVRDVLSFMEKAVAGKAKVGQ